MWVLCLKRCTLYLKVAENEIEKVRKKDTFPAIRYLIALTDNDSLEFIIVIKKKKKRRR